MDQKLEKAFQWFAEKLKESDDRMEGRFWAIEERLQKIEDGGEPLNRGMRDPGSSSNKNKIRFPYSSPKGQNPKI
jgi:hypothetical protein